MDNAELEITQLVTEKYMDAVHSGDPLQYAALFTDDAIWMPPGAETVVGRVAIEDAERNIFVAVSLQIEAQCVEYRVEGDIAWAIGEIDGLKIPHDDGDKSPFHFKLLWLLKQESGKWKIHRQLWNNRPVAD